MFCTACGNQLSEADRFCSQCGQVKPGATLNSVIPAAAPKARFQRVMGNRKIAGVCSGLAAYLGWDVTLIRVLFVVLVVASGISIVAYAALWIVMPRDDRPENSAANPPHSAASQV